MEQYKQRLDKIEAVLNYWLPDFSSEQSQAGRWAENIFPDIGKNIGIEEIRFLVNPLKDIISRGGKRWRPLLMTLICEALGGGDAAVPLVPLIEFPHNASLIHDDIEDDSEQRRGKPAVHKLYGVDTAINAGSFLYFLSSNCIDSCELEDKKLIYKMWSNCLRKLHLGQAMDIYWHRNVPVVPNIEEYYTMTGLKTGSLACLAAELGCYAAGAPPETTRRLCEAAEKMGIGFQILDDVKNLKTGNPGKKRGDDIVEGKKSLPVLLYMHKYPEKRDRVFYNFVIARKEGVSAPEVEELISVFTEAGVLEEAEEKGHSLLNETKEIFNSPEIAGYALTDSGRDLLVGFINLIS
ncbi:MAG: polyprenyl synthetase family protein [Treponema sp.]|nr:polyprenyl synthetase family protein [Treponema sp.]